MNDETLSKLTSEFTKAVATHGKILKCMIEVNAMNAANEDRRSHAKPDKYGAFDFIEKAKEVEEHIKELEKTTNEN